MHMSVYVCVNEPALAGRTRAASAGHVRVRNSVMASELLGCASRKQMLLFLLQDALSLAPQVSDPTLSFYPKQVAPASLGDSER